MTTLYRLFELPKMAFANWLAWTNIINYLRCFCPPSPRLLFPFLYTGNEKAALALFWPLFCTRPALFDLEDGMATASLRPSTSISSLVVVGSTSWFTGLCSEASWLPSIILMSFFVDIACDFEASSSSFTESLSFLASSTGPKTWRRRIDLFAFFVLDRRPLAILRLWRCVWMKPIWSKCV